jgi:hypothetical protein
MTVVMQPTQQNHDALGTDDRLVRGMGISANEILEHRRRLTQMYYESSEVLLSYPPDSSLFVNPSIFERFVRRSLGDTFNDLKRLRTWDIGWNGYDAPKPEYTAIEHARFWITSLFQTVANLGWIKPSVTGGPEGGVVFEWWYGKRKLTVYVEEQSIEYVQVWGTDVDAKITDGAIESMSDSRELWMWLIGLK